MSLIVEIPDDLAIELQQQAAERGTPPEQVAINALRHSLAVEKRLNEALAPIREAFEQSGMTEDEAVELFEAEKHAMRRGE
jgi:hypothetical protein